MKKLLCVLLAVCLVFSVTGCGGDEIVGNYKLISYKIDSKEKITKDLEKELAEKNVFIGSMVINEDGSAFYYLGDTKTELRWNENELWDVHGDIFKYTLEDNQLKITLRYGLETETHRLIFDRITDEEAAKITAVFPEDTDWWGKPVDEFTGTYKLISVSGREDIQNSLDMFTPQKRFSTLTIEGNRMGKLDIINVGVSLVNYDSAKHTMKIGNEEASYTFENEIITITVKTTGEDGTESEYVLTFNRLTEEDLKDEAEKK